MTQDSNDKPITPLKEYFASFDYSKKKLHEIVGIKNTDELLNRLDGTLLECIHEWAKKGGDDSYIAIVKVIEDFTNRLTVDTQEDAYEIIRIIIINMLAHAIEVSIANIVEAVKKQASEEGCSTMGMH